MISVTNASGTCAITAAKAADSNYNAVSDGPSTVSLVKADATVVVNGYTDNAPKEVVEKTRQILAEKKGELRTIEAQLK